MDDQEKHDLFANGLALILPRNTVNPGTWIGTIQQAREGRYSADVHEWVMDYPYTSKRQWKEQIPAVEALWLACYQPGNE